MTKEEKQELARKLVAGAVIVALMLSIFVPDKNG